MRESLNEADFEEVVECCRYLYSEFCGSSEFSPGRSLGRLCLYLFHSFSVFIKHMGAIFY